MRRRSSPALAARVTTSTASTKRATLPRAGVSSSSTCESAARRSKTPTSSGSSSGWDASKGNDRKRAEWDARARGRCSGARCLRERSNRRRPGADSARHRDWRGDRRAADDHVVSLVDGRRARAALDRADRTGSGARASAASRRARRARRTWPGRRATATADSAQQAHRGRQGGANARIHLEHRRHRVLDQVCLAVFPVRRNRAHRARHRSPPRRPRPRLAAAAGRGRRFRLHADRGADRRQGHRRGQSLTRDDRRGGQVGRDARARRLCGGATTAEGQPMMRITHLCVGLLVAAATTAHAATAEVAEAAMRGDRAAVRAALARKADVNAPQADGSTALHWAAENDDVEMADILLEAGAHVAARTREGVTPLQLAATNGSAPMLGRLIRAGADPDAGLTPAGDTALMLAARTGRSDAIRILLESGAHVTVTETWGGTTPLMWAVSEGHADAARLLIAAGAGVNARSHYVAAANGRGFEGRTPVATRADPRVEEFASGWLTPLMFAAREGHLDLARMLVAAGADVDAVAGDGKTALAVAIFNGNYAVASFLVDKKADVNKADAQRFTPLFWAVDRRNMETAPNFPWMVTADPLPLIRQLLDAGANPNALVDNTPRSRMREGSPRIVFATSLMRVAFAGDLDLVKLLLEHGADPTVISRDGETMIEAAAGLGFIQGYNRGRSQAERLEVVKLFVSRGADVNQADDYGITPLMVAANMGDTAVIQYLVDAGADLAAYDLGKKNDGAFGASVEPLMPIDYAIGVGTFVPNNAVVIHQSAVALMQKLMKERSIVHTTSECTLRGFTCAQADVDPKVASPAEIQKMRKLAVGYQLNGVTGGLEVKEAVKKK